MENTAHTSLQAAAVAQLAAETLSGDVRDVLLTQVRGMQIPWSQLSEKDQQWRIEAIQKLAETVVRRAMTVVAHQGFTHLDVRIATKGKFGDGGIELTANAPFTVDNMMRLAEHKGGSAILVLTEVGEFFGQRRAARAEPDQRAMPLGEDEGVDETALEAEGVSYAATLRMIEAAPELIGLTFDLTAYTEEERADLASKIIEKKGKVYLGPEDAADGGAGAPADSAETQEPAPEAAPKTARRTRRQIRETEAA
ncbi:hypothetical protein FV232_00995 [Methylobacterium sp. WL30]|uniref:hypothetical protein n=1 Tax=unclassified Methylobacterium TaxID=2615210 RepID=UPI0011C8D47E|nr:MULTISPECIES: hypothetical protein [unclassified Methylobacterium]TXN38968.1 hypothetical protein FV225_11605 [Methylobacterium sp. WL93]TXN52255.1 hypothetical protein FV227_04175 [Methylobacterium sp. WL119]TXN70662.1 hypothetical protein FV232_00995 [Methylobacterium sp. WL30]